VDALRKIRLFTRAGEYVATLENVPPFWHVPDVVTWGDRTFIACADGRFREAFAYHHASINATAEIGVVQVGECQRAGDSVTETSARDALLKVREDMAAFVKTDGKPLTMESRVTIRPCIAKWLAAIDVILERP